MSSRPGLSALTIIALALAGGLYTILSGNQPLLGLDLQGGVSVVLQPTGEASDEALDQSVEIIRSRVDALGVAEPEISRQGSTIVVDLPGVEQQQRALELVGQTAELRFRPVVVDLGFIDPPPSDGDGDDAGPGDDDTTDTTDAPDGEEPTDEGEEPTDDGEEPTDDGEEPTDDEEGSLGVIAGRFAPLVMAQDDDTETDGTETDGTETDDTTTTTEASEDETTTTVAADDDAADDDAADSDADDAFDTPPAQQGTSTPEQLAIIEVCSGAQITAPEDDIAEQPVVLATDDGRLVCLGPTVLKGDTLETAGVDLGPTGEWVVSPVFKPGAEGVDQFNAAATECFNGTGLCPPTRTAAGVGPGRLAIVLDGRVVSDPAIQQPVFPRDGIQITGAFEEEEARDLASVLRFGALPLELETQQARTVSATIGDDVMRAGVIAGLLGLGLVAIYLLAYYRLAGLVALGGLVLSALFLWTIIAWFGENLGLALTLAGVVGLIVSVGVSADSNIVYFENVKDAYRGGRTVTTSVERAYQSAISTIVKADAVSLIAALLLYVLTVGAVRGFAFYLGLATLLDLFISWLFMRPALLALARRQAVEKNPSLLGLPGGEPS